MKQFKYLQHELVLVDLWATFKMFGKGFNKWQCYREWATGWTIGEPGSIRDGAEIYRFFTTFYHLHSAICDV
jgi:hypothetical protein